MKYTVIEDGTVIDLSKVQAIGVVLSGQAGRMKGIEYYFSVYMPGGAINMYSDNKEDATKKRKSLISKVLVR